MNLHDYLQQRQDERLKSVRSYSNYNRQREIQKDRLNPVNFYASFGIELKKASRWQLVKCPFHDDTHASMGVNREHGGFKCHACEAKGDMIGFYMKYKGVDFLTACKQLNLIG